MFTEDELLPLSGLQHLVYCQRRAALVHLEHEWASNVFTVEGVHLHHRADEDAPRSESRGDLRVARGVALRSLRLGLIGKADVVEFHRVDRDRSTMWVPFPVEYKRSALKRERGYEIQLCAQAICFEEMLDANIPAGAIYYGKSKRRLEIMFDGAIREETEAAARQFHAIVRSMITPAPEPGPKCEKCSLFERCLPNGISGAGSARAYIERLISTTSKS